MNILQKNEPSDFGLSTDSLLSAERWEAYREILLAYVESRMPRSLRRNLGASDIVQNTLIKAKQQGNQFRGSTPEELESWLTRIAERLIIDNIRRYRSAPKQGLSSGENRHQDEPVDDNTPSKELMATEDFNLLMLAISELPDELRQIVLLRHASKLSIDNVAKQLDLPPARCRRRWLEALNMLSKRLKPIL